MKQAIIEAKRALKINEVPIGCVIVCNDKIIARGYNKRERLQSSIAHAEILAIQKACKALGTWRLDDCTLYVTLEPCIMCAGAIIQSRIKRVVYGAYDYRFGADKSFVNIFSYRFNHSVIVSGGILENECKILLQNFFKSLRDN